MRTITKKIDLYKYEELDKEVQDILLEKELEDLMEDYCETSLYGDMSCQADYLLKEYFNIDSGLNNVYYDLSYSQGSGSMIEFTINIEDLNNKYHILDDEEMKYVREKGIVNEINIYHNDNLYYHEYTFGIEYYDNFGYWDYEDIKDEYNISEERFNTIEDRILKLLDSYNKHNTESKFIEDIINMNRQLTKYGYNLIEDKESWKEIAVENLNEHEYTENGEIGA